MIEKPDVIHTGRLCLRPMTDQDKDDVLDLLTDEEVTRTFMVPQFASREAALPIFERFVETSRAPERFVYGIDLDGRLIGFLNDVEMTKDSVELGYVIHPARKNCGYATETLDVAVAALFEMGFSRVRAGAFEENGASLRVMEKCGMTRTGETEVLEYRGVVHRCILCEIRK